LDTPKTCYNLIIENTRKQGIETMNNELQNILNGFGSTERFLIGKDPYDPKTVEDLVEAIATDIQDAITALENNEESKMVRKVRNGYRVKIGYGAKNEAVLKFPTATNENNAYRFFESKSKHREAKRIEAINFLLTIKDAFEAGQLDDVLEAKLESYRDRAAKGKEARSKVVSIAA
jgi:hypothetical protein